MTVNEILQEAKSHNREERLALWDGLWEFLDEDQKEIHLSDAQVEEIKRRVARVDANPGTGSDWENVKARIRVRKNK
jgi:putative addiction module component (TIGR02574 family)